MNYTKKSFSVTAPGTQAYRDNWERTFRGECGAPFPGSGGGSCVLPNGHDSYHQMPHGRAAVHFIQRWRDNGEILC